MTCGACAAGIKYSLERMEGVQSANVIFKGMSQEGEVEVKYDRKKVSKEQIRKKIETLGYNVGKDAEKKMKIEILYFDGCPTYKLVEKWLNELREEEGFQFELELINVDSDEKAVQLKFTGSPTVRVNGEELFPPSPEAPYARTCRMFCWNGKMHGAPPREMLHQKISALIKHS